MRLIIARTGRVEAGEIRYYEEIPFISDLCQYSHNIANTNNVTSDLVHKYIRAICVYHSDDIFHKLHNV